MHKIGEGKKDERMRGMGGTSVRARGPSGGIQEGMGITTSREQGQFRTHCCT